jgi:hypothetical protein
LLLCHEQEHHLANELVLGERRAMQPNNFGDRAAQRFLCSRQQVHMALHLLLLATCFLAIFTQIGNLLRARTAAVLPAAAIHREHSSLQAPSERLLERVSAANHNGPPVAPPFLARCDGQVWSLERPVGPLLESASTGSALAEAAPSTAQDAIKIAAESAGEERWVL